MPSTHQDFVPCIGIVIVVSNRAWQSVIDRINTSAWHTVVDQIDCCAKQSESLYMTKSPLFFSLHKLLLFDVLEVVVNCGVHWLGLENRHLDATR